MDEPSGAMAVIGPSMIVVPSFSFLAQLCVGWATRAAKAAAERRSVLRIFDIGRTPGLSETNSETSVGNGVGCRPPTADGARGYLVFLTEVVVAAAVFAAAAAFGS